MNLADINSIKSLLNCQGFSFKKSLGQNFLINPDVCPSMADAACDSETGVLEIGPGIGVLTEQLSKKAKKVVTIELDKRLEKLLDITLKDCDNVKIIFGDAMKLDLQKIIEENFSDCKRVSVCANLPYYITSPIVMMLLENRLPIDNITVMVQLEAAERLCAEVGSRDAGAVTVAVTYYAEKEILFDVGRESFLPSPNVDSAVIQLKIRKEPAIKVTDENKFFKLVKAAFAQRRKTFVNTVSNTMGIEKNKIKAALNEIGISETIRGEQLTMENLASLSELI